MKGMVEWRRHLGSSGRDESRRKRMGIHIKREGDDKDFKGEKTLDTEKSDTMALKVLLLN